MHEIWFNCDVDKAIAYARCMKSGSIATSRHKSYSIAFRDTYSGAFMHTYSVALMDVTCKAVIG